MGLPGVDRIGAGGANKVVEGDLVTGRMGGKCQLDGAVGERQHGMVVLRVDHAGYGISEGKSLAPIFKGKAAAQGGAGGAPVRYLGQQGSDARLVQRGGAVDAVFGDQAHAAAVFRWAIRTEAGGCES